MSQYNPFDLSEPIPELSNQHFIQAVGILRRVASNSTTPTDSQTARWLLAEFEAAFEKHNQYCQQVSKRYAEKPKPALTPIRHNKGKRR